MTIAHRFWLWSAAVLMLALLFVFQVRPNLRIETDLLALLPPAEQDPQVSEALERYSDSLSHKLLFLIGAPEFADARHAAEGFAEKLSGSGAFTRVDFKLGGQLDTITQSYLPYRHQLLSPALRQRLQASDGGQLMSEALAALYAPAGLPRPLPIAQDPFNLLGDFLTQALPSTAARPREDVLSVDGNGRSYVLLSAEIEGSPFASDTQSRVMPTLSAALAEARAQPGVEVLGSGLIQHAAQATSSAQREIGIVGTLSMIGVVLMVLATFRSPLPLLLSALVLGCGALAAVVVCHYVFGRIHLITLVFGTGLIGVAIDYSNHFLADQFRHPQQWTGEQALRHVGPGIAMGMSCAVLGYAALALAPLPGLRQMAIFSAAGMITACISVLCWHPLLARRSRRDSAPLMLRAALAADRALGRVAALRGAKWMLVGVLALGALGLARLHFVDDVRSLQASSPELLSQEKSLRELLRQVPDNRLLLVRGDSPAQVLATEEKLGTALDALVAKGELSAYLALSHALPSPQRQAENRALLASQIYAPDGLATRLMSQLGFPASVSASLRRDFEQSAAAPLTLETWLQSPAAQPYRSLWLGQIGNGYASIVSPLGLRDAAALSALQIPGVTYVDRIAGISDVLGRYRERAIALIAGAYLLIGLLMALRYGALTALRLLAVPVGAALLTLALFGLVDRAVNLFNVLALFLVLGLGVDYAVFLREGREARGPTLLALALSTLGTVLSYGLLAFSATPFIRSLGLTLLIGIALTFVLALLSQRPAKG